MEPKPKRLVKNFVSLGSFYLFRKEVMKLIRIESGRLEPRGKIITEYILENTKGFRFRTRNRKELKKIQEKTNA